MGLLLAAEPSLARCEEGSGTGGTGLVGSGTGGTGLGGDEGSGTGGTGHSGSGSGGTGLEGREGSGTGGTGVFGTVTGFGSICINELEVEYDDRTRVEQDGQQVSTSELRVGQVVHLRTRGSDELRAHSITIETALAGPVEQVDRSSGRMVVMGQSVRMRPDTRVFDRAQNLEVVSKGDRISISGLRSPDGTVVASRIDRQADSAPDVTTGPTTVVGPRVLYVGDIRAELRETPDEPSLGRAQLSGRWNAETRSLEDAEARSAPIRPDHGGRFSLEGYAERTEDAVRVQGVDVDLDSLSPDRRAVATGDRVRIRGHFDDGGRLRVDALSAEPRRRDVEHDFEQGDSDRSDREGREDREDREDRSGRGDRTERSERPERSERSERPERPEREDRSGR